MKKTNELQPVVAEMKDEATLLISQAIDKGVDVLTMEKLLAMRRELKAEKAKEAFDASMASFQATCPTIQRTKQAYNYKYAPLESIVEQVQSLLSENGFSYTFDTDDVENAIIVYCKVKHTGGHMEVSKARIIREATTKMNASQQSGAAMTYGKRYAFCNAFGILTGDEDNDGATIQQPTVSHSQKPTTIPSQPNVGADKGYVVTPTPKENITPQPLTNDQKIEINTLLAKKGKTRLELEGAVSAVSKNKTESYAELTYKEAEALLIKMRSLPDKKGEMKATTPEPEINIDEVAKGIEQTRIVN